jgi:hypothetical protein
VTSWCTTRTLAAPAGDKSERDSSAKAHRRVKPVAIHMAVLGRPSSLRLQGCNFQAVIWSCHQEYDWWSLPYRHLGSPFPPLSPSFLFFQRRFAV